MDKPQGLLSSGTEGGEGQADQLWKDTGVSVQVYILRTKEAEGRITDSVYLPVGEGLMRLFSGGKSWAEVLKKKEELDRPGRKSRVSVGVRMGGL